MTRNEANLYLATVLTTLAEMPRHEAPEGHLYMALQHAGCNLEDFYGVKSILVDGGLVTAEMGPQLKLTAKGKELADDINAKLAAVKQEVR